MVWVAQQSFAYGELDPSVFALADSNPYRAGCQTLTNAILTRFGGARKRYGTRVIGQTYQNQEAAIFEYTAFDKNYIVEISVNDSTETDRRLRVWDTTTRAVADVFQASIARGPFPALADTDAVIHHFRAAELDDIQAFQHQDRIYFTHPGRPPLYLEREQLGTNEFWEYGVAPIGDVTPIVVDSGVNVALALAGPASGQLDADAPIFNKNDEGSYWRIEGRPATASLYGVWYRMDTVRDSQEAQGVRIYGALDTQRRDSSDWIGPYIVDKDLNGYTATMSSPNSTLIGDERTFTITAGSPGNSAANRLGVPVTIDGFLWIIHTINNANEFVATRLEGGGTIPDGVNRALDYLTLADRPHVTRRQAFPKGSTGPGGVDIVQVFTPAVATEWLPDGTEDAQDNYFVETQEFDIGGTIHMNGGVLAVYEVEFVLNGGTAYNCVEVEPLQHFGPSLHWGLGWSHGVGFPSCGTSHQGRLFFGGFEQAPNRVVASQTFVADNFRLGPNDDNPLSFDVNDPDGGTVTWMVSAQDLLLGTERSEYAIVGQPITPSQVGVDRQSGYGGANRNVLLASNNAIFVDADQKGIREMSFVFERDRYQAPDLTDLATHLFDGKTIIRIESIVAPDSYIATLFSDGTMAALTYRRENGVVGWSPWTQPSWPNATNTTTDLSTIETIAANRAPTGARDELWLVRRWISNGESNPGTTVRTIEVMSDEYGNDQEIPFASPTVLGANMSTLSPLFALQANNIHLMNDGLYLPPQSSGVDGSGNYLWGPIGYTVAPTEAIGCRPIPFALTPLVQQFSIPGQGSTHGRLKNISSVILYLNGARGGTVGDKNIGTENIPRSPTVVDPVTEIVGWHTVVGVGEFGQQVGIDIVQNNGYAFEIGGINVEADYGTGIA